MSIQADRACFEVCVPVFGFKNLLGRTLFMTIQSFVYVQLVLEMSMYVGLVLEMSVYVQLVLEMSMYVGLVLEMSMYVELVLEVVRVSIGVLSAKCPKFFRCPS